MSLYKLRFYFLFLINTNSSHAQYLTNPILAGFYPDPSICRAGNDYYIVNSSFAYYPGLPIFHSKDLLNWKLIGHAMDRPSQLDLDSAGVSRGLFAPAISYHNGVFYIVCTLIDKMGNFVITTKDPAGPWSDPVALPQVNGIDPSLFFDDNGKAYILYNSIPPNNISLHDGHRTIRMFEFDAASLKVTGEEKLLINGGTDMSKKPVWIEGPHIIRKDGWYYLICAEGGTGYNHSEVVFRSRTIDGPYISYEKNPILTQRHLDPNRKNPITTTGHADFVEGPDGKWWAVFLGCRPYEGDFYNTGRETFMAPVEWKDGWPTINPGVEEVQYKYPINATLNKKSEKYNGNYYFRDEFDDTILNKRYSFLRTVREKWYSVNDRWIKKGCLSIKLRPETIHGKENPSFVAFRQPHLSGHAAAALRFDPFDPKEKVGLMVFQNETHYYFICLSRDSAGPVIQLFKGPGKKGSSATPELLAVAPVTSDHDDNVFFKITSNGGLSYSFWYATGKKIRDWKLLRENLDGKFLSTKTAGGFVGSMYAMYATSNGQLTDRKAFFEWFECKNNDRRE